MQLLDEELDLLNQETPNAALKILRDWCAVHSGSEEIDMLCPICSHQVAPVWQDLYTFTTHQGAELEHPANTLQSELPTGQSSEVRVNLTWARCPNEECREILVIVTRELRYYGNVTDRNQWYAVPKKKAAHPIDAIVLKLQLGKDFQEASAILDDSPRMSTVLSRRILADLLKRYAALNDYGLAARIDKFIADKQHPSRLRENLHYLREMGDFGAHTMEDDQGHIFNVQREEAEWTLKTVIDLFDYFIVAPEKDKALRESVDKKLEQAGRKPLKKS